MNRVSGSNPHLWQIAAVRDLFWVGLFICFFVIIYYLHEIFVPIFIGLMAAYIFNPLIDDIQKRWKWPRLLTVSAITLSIIVLELAFAAWLVPLIIRQMTDLAASIPTYLISLAERYDIQLGSLANELQKLAERLRQDPLSIIRTILTGTSRAVGFIGTVIGGTTYVVISTVLIPVYFFFFARHFPAMIEWTQTLLPASKKERIIELARTLDQAIGAFFRGRVIICLIMSVMFATGWFWTGVPYWFLLGVVTGLLNLVPYASAFGWPLAVVLKYLDATTGSGTPGFDFVSVFVWPSVVYIVVQTIEGWILTPWIQSESVHLSPITILIVVLFGGAIAGVYGLILAIPIAACLKIIAMEVVLPHVQERAARN